MIILGIDPGSRRIGYGLIQTLPARTKFLSAGILKIKKQSDPDALLETKRQVDGLIRKWQPEILALEKIFFMNNQKTAIAVAQARGVILLAGRAAGLAIMEFAPNEVKSALTGYGLADKKAVLKMVRLILRTPDLNVIDDASDALALALVAQGRSWLGKA